MNSNNLLYPREDRVNMALLYACRNCDYQEESDHKMVYRNQLTTQKMYFTESC